MTRPHDDQGARNRIRTDLATNMLVEAGAGSGKTTALVGRLLEHVRTGTPVDRLAAVTFTRKAANELRERFQEGLERAIRERVHGSEEATRFEEALRGIERAFLGTIHAFCARILRERPLEIAVDPDFEEVSGDDWTELCALFWRRWVERAKQEGNPALQAVEEVGIEPRELHGAFTTMVMYPDVHFPVEVRPAPDVAPCRTALESLMRRARSLMPAEEPVGGWDRLMSLVKRLEFLRDIGDWSETVSFCAAVETIGTSHVEPTQRKWGEARERKAAAKALGDAFKMLLMDQSAPVMRGWREHRYPIVMHLLRDAAREFERQRHATGALGFEDLLLLTARLLREHPAVRDDLGAHYAHLLVDEFQDTDPVQAEVCLLLASDASEGSDWTRVTPRPGSLFVVGDPKQSIYRFRRADIEVYEFVKRRMAACGEVLALTANFRSNDALRDVVNDHCSGVFPAEASPQQAPFRAMQTLRAAEGGEGVFRYEIRYDGRGQERLLRLDASLLASWIAARVARGERQAGDFLILTPQRRHIEYYARALAERNVAVTTTGAALPQEHELRELLVLLRALADPDDSVAVVAALEGLFLGFSPADLWEAWRAGARFGITHPPLEGPYAARDGLRQLHEWWKMSQRHAADVVVDQLLDETGLLAHAASQPLGEGRAGALLHLVESLRLASVRGTSGIAAAIERLEVILDSDAPDAPLRPGRLDAVRVMNLHKAKGLEATVVCLAAPVDAKAHEPRLHVRRGNDGRAEGWVQLVGGDANTTRILAQPPDWEARCHEVEEFERAEEERLRYVAVTRARCELVVAQGTCVQRAGDKADTSIWRPLARTLSERASVLALEEDVPPGRLPLLQGADALDSATHAAGERVSRAGRSSFVVRAVTERVKAVPPPPGGEGGGETEVLDAVETVGAPGAGVGSAQEFQPTSPRHAPSVADGNADARGTAWGRAVHRSIEALGRGRRGEALGRYVRAIARDEALPLPWHEELVDVVRGLEARGTLSPDRAEVRLELTLMACEGGEGEATTITEGIVDAAILGPEGWEVIDWKSDVVGDRRWQERQAVYERQVRAYTDLLSRLTGLGARGRVERIATSG